MGFFANAAMGFAGPLEGGGPRGKEGGVEAGGGEPRVRKG